MAKEIEVVNEAGETVKETVYTADEYKGLETNLATKETELVQANKLLAERGENFKSFSKLTEEDKKNYDANTLNLLRVVETLETEITSTKTQLSDKTEKERTSAKTNALNLIHQGDADTKKKLEDEYALLTGMPETTPEEINARAKKAATLAGIQIDPRNPLYTSVNGEAPKVPDNKNYVETPEGAQAAEMVRSAMGITEPKK